jgi:hypothetical protein
MKLKFKAVMAYLTAVAMALTVATILTVGAVAQENRAVERIPTFCNRTAGIRVWDFIDNTGNEFGFNTLYHREENIRSPGGVTNNFFNAPYYTDVRGLQVQFFFDWENEDWGDADEGESPWDGHSISIARLGIHTERGRNRDFVQDDFAFVRELTEGNQILIGAEEVIVTVPIIPAENTDWFRATVTSWAETPGSALVHLLDENGDIIRLFCNECDGDDALCQCPCPTGCGNVYSACTCDLTSTCDTCDNLLVACTCIPACATCGNAVPDCECVPVTAPPVTTATAGGDVNPSTAVAVALLPTLAAGMALAVAGMVKSTKKRD